MALAVFIDTGLYFHTFIQNKILAVGSKRHQLDWIEMVKDWMICRLYFKA